ncbi:MAG: hypothetical protein NVSMB39_1800 [Candidatus Saccharimonadales bacterium]
MKFPNVKLRPNKKQLKQVDKWLKFTPIALALVGSAALIVLAWPVPVRQVTGADNLPGPLRKNFNQAVQSVHNLEKRQREIHMQVVTESNLSAQLSGIELDAASGDFTAATADIAALNKSLVDWNYELSGRRFAGSDGTGSATGAGVYLPILVYHYPPPNFEAQLTHLEQAGYATIDLDQADAGLHGGPLPAKPVVITFDDGFAVQMSAYQALLRHHMKATFYIFDGGEASNWCIGAGRRYNDPLQPAKGCGDAYLNWDQVRMIDRSGLMTIGGHTVNHRNLANLPVDQQRFEIITGKQQLEAQLGHPIRHFAYPYGAFNAESIQLVQEAGYITATTTEGGSVQVPGSDYTLRRMRDALTLK